MIAVRLKKKEERKIKRKLIAKVIKKTSVWECRTGEKYAGFVSTFTTSGLAQFFLSSAFKINVRYSFVMFFITFWIVYKLMSISLCIYAFLTTELIISILLGDLHNCTHLQLQGCLHVPFHSQSCQRWEPFLSRASMTWFKVSWHFSKRIFRLTISVFPSSVQGNITLRLFWYR